MAPATLNTTVPPSLETAISPTWPFSSGSRVMVFSSPSAAARPATVVPRMPMVAVGVDTVMLSGPSLATSPETKENTPCTRDALKVPFSPPGS